MQELATGITKTRKRDPKSHSPDSYRDERDLSSKRERIINVVEVLSFTAYINLNSLLYSF